jgi:hypothetical protein
MIHMAKVYKELSDKLKFGLNKMGIAARKAKLGNFLDSLGSFAKITVDYEEGHETVELLEDDLPASPIVFIQVDNSDATATLTVPTGVFKLYIVRNISSNTLRFTPKGGNYYAVAAGDILVLIEITAGTFAKLGDTVTASSPTTFTNKTLTAPTINGGTINESVIKKAKHDGASIITHNFEEDALTWAMTADDAKNDIIVVGTTAGAATIILPDRTTDTKQFTIFNSASSYAVTVKGEGEDVGVTIAAGKSAIIFELQNHVYRITDDSPAVAD